MVKSRVIEKQVVSLIVLKNRLYAQALKQLESEFPELLEIGRNINHSYDKMVAEEHVWFRDS